ncbi:hypothetical protein SLA2020_398720 [Shorea laevis]
MRKSRTPPTYLATFPSTRLHTNGKLDGKKLHGKDENVGGERVALPNAFRRKESFCFVAINQDIDGRCTNHRHNKLDDI